MGSAERDIEFLFEIGSLNNVDRSWRQHLGMKCATVPEHTIRVVWIALMLAKQMEGIDEAKLIRMALVHDIAETRVSDLSYMQKVYVKADEERAARDLFVQTSVQSFEDMLREYETRESLEAKIVKDADNLDIDVEIRELEERGSQLPAKWKDNRKLVRNEKLYTEAAKQLWDDIQSSDPASWHLKNNKWYKVPEAGK